MSASPEVIVDLLRQDIDYRRSIQWNIFSWCSTLHVAIAGGMIALRTSPAFSLGHSQQAIISSAVLLMSAFSIPWLLHHAHKEKFARERLSQAVNDPIWKQTNPFRGQIIAIFVLGITAMASVWWPLKVRSAPCATYTAFFSMRVIQTRITAPTNATIIDPIIPPK